MRIFHKYLFSPTNLAFFLNRQWRCYLGKTRISRKRMELWGHTYPGSKSASLRIRDGLISFSRIRSFVLRALESANFWSEILHFWGTFFPTKKKKKTIISPCFIFRLKMNNLDINLIVFSFSINFNGNCRINTNFYLQILAFFPHCQFK